MCESDAKKWKEQIDNWIPKWKNDLPNKNMENDDWAFYLEHFWIWAIKCFGSEISQNIQRQLPLCSKEEGFTSVWHGIFNLIFDRKFNRCAIGHRCVCSFLVVKSHPHSHGVNSTKRKCKMCRHSAGFLVVFLLCCTRWHQSIDLLPLTIYFMCHSAEWHCRPKNIAGVDKVTKLRNFSHLRISWRLMTIDGFYWGQFLLSGRWSTKWK